MYCNFCNQIFLLPSALLFWPNLNKHSCKKCGEKARKESINKVKKNCATIQCSTEGQATKAKAMGFNVKMI